jgi:hypothetical protein
MWDSMPFVCNHPGRCSWGINSVPPVCHWLDVSRGEGSSICMSAIWFIQRPYLQQMFWGYLLCTNNLLTKNNIGLLLISNFHRVLNVVCFLLDNSPRVWILCADGSEHHLFHLRTYLPVKMEQTSCSEMLAYRIQTAGNYPEGSL